MARPTNTAPSVSVTVNLPPGLNEKLESLVAEGIMGKSRGDVLIFMAQKEILRMMEAGRFTDAKLK